MDLDAIDPAALADPAFAVVLGISLAATAGLRAFMPLFSICVFAWMGQVELGDSFAWMGTPVAAICFGTAVVVEVLADKIPVVDHALDGVGLVVKPIAGTLATSTMITGMDPVLTVVVGLATGGVAAGGVHLVKAKVRVMSSLFTAAHANPIISLFEDAVALVGVVVAWIAPVVIVVVGIVSGGWLLRRSRKREPSPS